jgi:hypothetical protein
MKSPRGFAAAVVFLIALPVALLAQTFVGGGAEVVIHAAFALGSALMAFAVFDFNTPRWIVWVGCASTGALAALFLLQGVSDVVRSASLTHLAYQVFGQQVERGLVDLFLSWCIAVLLCDSRSPTRMFGVVALAIVVGVEAHAVRLSAMGTSLDAEAPGLKLLMLLPFCWLLVESRRVGPMPPELNC